MRNYPRSKRNVEERGETKSEEDRKTARQFGKDFFDGDRSVGYGGLSYNPRFWEPVIPDFQSHWSLTAESSVLDVGCAKGFMLYDLQRLIPGITYEGIDISEYAIDNAHPEVKDHVRVASCDDLPFEDNSFDVTISITTVHNMNFNGCIRTLKEIERVSRKGSFITVDAYHNDEEKKRMEAWNLTALTVLHVDEWRELFDKAGYTGDYYWFIP
ncbi:MAG: class I SAM-dependent methyltransferase [Methyloligellaceae bacterium]